MKTGLPRFEGRIPGIFQSEFKRVLIGRGEQGLHGGNGDFGCREVNRIRLHRCCREPRGQKKRLGEDRDEGHTHTSSVEVLPVCQGTHQAWRVGWYACFHSRNPWRHCDVLPPHPRLILSSARLLKPVTSSRSLGVR